MLKPSTPVNEEKYLKKAAWLSIIISVLFSLELFYDSLSVLKESHTGFFILIAMTYLVLIMAMCNLLYNIVISTWHIKNAWLGRFQDEYFKEVNLKAAYYALGVLGLFLMVVIWLDFLLPEAIRAMNLQSFSKLSMGVGFITYGASILWELKKSDDDACE